MYNYFYCLFLTIKFREKPVWNWIHVKKTDMTLAVLKIVIWVHYVFAIHMPVLLVNVPKTESWLAVIHLPCMWRDEVKIMHTLPVVLWGVKEYFKFYGSWCFHPSKFGCWPSGWGRPTWNAGTLYMQRSSDMPRKLNWQEKVFLNMNKLRNSCSVCWRFHCVPDCCEWPAAW